MDIDELKPGTKWEDTRDVFREIDRASGLSDSMALAWLRHCKHNNDNWSAVHDLWVSKPEEFKRFIVLYRLGVHADG